MRGGCVVDDHCGQPVHTHPPGQGDRLMVAALVQLRVANQHEDPSVCVCTGIEISDDWPSRESLRRHGFHVAVLRTARADPIDPQRRQPAALPSLDAAPDLGDPCRPGTRPDARGDRRRARSAPGRKDTNPSGLGAIVKDVAAPARCPHCGARAPPRQTRELYRVRLPVAEELRALQHGRSCGGTWSRSAILARGLAGERVACERRDADDRQGGTQERASEP